jgi:predicted phage-related endonuclease
MLDDGSHLDLSDNNYLCSGLLPEREKLKAELSAGEKRVSEIDSIIKAAMGNASSAWIPGYNLTYRSQSRKEVTIPAKTFRVLRVRAAAEEEGADVQ